jgi:hypothetical protein
MCGSNHVVLSLVGDPRRSTQFIIQSPITHLQVRRQPHAALVRVRGDGRRGMQGPIARAAPGEDEGAGAGVDVGTRREEARDEDGPALVDLGGNWDQEE